LVTGWAGERQRIAVVGRGEPAPSHVVFAFEQQGVRGVVAVFEIAEIGDQLGIVRQAADTHPFPHEAPHLGALVGVFRRRVAAIGPLRPAAEIDADRPRAAELVQPVEDAPADAGAVDEHRFGFCAH
jgi:hypothetical protein